MQVKCLRHDRRLRNSQSGSVLVLMLVVAVVIGVVAYVVSNLVGQVLNSLSDEEFQLEAQMLAADLREYTKYMLSFEKVTFVRAPLQVDSARRNNMLQLWDEEPWSPDYSENINIANVCGGYDAKGGLMGTLRLGQDPVFCPMMVRQPDLTTKVLQDSLFNMWSSSSKRGMVWKDNATLVDQGMEPVFEQDTTLPAGMYRMSYHFSSRKDNSDSFDKDWYRNPANSVPVYVGQRLLDYATNETGIEIKAKVIVDFFTDDMGFVGKMSERFFRIRSEVTIVRGGKEYPYVEVESFVSRTPIQKDFALFIMYPMDASGALKTKFSETVKMHKDSNIRGRVYFNGDIDTPLDQLPNFHDTVFISGSLKTPVDFSNIPKFRQKFRRGIVTNISSSRYLWDGNCVPNGDPFATQIKRIMNGTGIRCRDEAGVRSINGYNGQLQDQCRCWRRISGTDSSGLKSWSYSPQNPYCQSSMNDTECNKELKKGDNFFKFFGPVEMEAGSFGDEFFLGSTQKLTITQSIHFYGTIVGGHIDVRAPVEFFSLPETKPGYRSIGTAEQLSKMSAEANRGGHYVEAPLMNMPLIQLSKDSFK